MDVRITGKRLQAANRSRQAKGIDRRNVAVVADNGVSAQTDAGPSEKHFHESAIAGADSNLKNLRKRALVRKFSTTWMEKVFGRISPSKAREMLVRKIKKRYFEQWYHVYWQSRIEWKLNIRADCHNRYQLCSKYWGAWKQFVEMRKDLRARVATVQRTVLLRLQAKYLNAWVVFVQITQAKRDVRQKALELGNRSRLRAAWQTWMAEHRMRALRCSLQRRVEQKWKKRLMSEVWLKWRWTQNQCSLERERQTLAVQLYYTKLLTVGMKRWKMYIRSQKEQGRMKVVAVNHYQNALLVKSFVEWYQRFQRVTELRQLQELIAAMNLKAKLRRYLRIWQLYVTGKQREQQQRDQAVEWHRRYQQRRCLTWIMKCAAQRHKEKQEEYTALKFRNEQILRHWWQEWMFCLEAAEERRMVPKTEIARAKSRTSTLKTAFHAWLRYHSVKQTELATRVLADSRVKKKLFHRYFSAWKEYNDQVHLERALKLKGIQYQRESLLAIFFYIWMDSTVRRQEGASLRGKAIACYDDQLKKAVFKEWRTRAVEENKLTAMEAQAKQYCNRMVLFRVFGVWQSQRNCKLTENENKEVSESYHRRKCLGVIWHAWMNYIELKRYKKHKQLLADNHHAKYLCQNVLTGWKVWLACHQAKELEYAAAVTLYQRKLLRHCVQMWHSNVSQLKIAKDMTTSAVQCYQATVLRECYIVWKNMTFGTSARANEQTDMLNAKACALNTKSKLHRAFYVWKHATLTHIEERTCLSSAMRCYSTNVMRKCFMAWKHYQRCQLRKKLLAQQSLWFSDMRIVSSFYSRWRVMLSQKLLEKSKTSIALWHWSRGLKHKCLCSWRIYSCDKRRKRARYATAMECYHRHLLKIGVASWTVYVSEKTAIMAKNVLQPKEEADRTLALLCIRHWKQVTQRKVHGRFSDHNPVPSGGGTMTDSGDETLSQPTIPPFLHHQRSHQSLHYVSDVQVQPTSQVPSVGGKLLEQPISSTDQVSMIMKTRDMLLELYKARMKQRKLSDKLQSLSPVSPEYTQVLKELQTVNSFLSLHEEVVVKEISVVHNLLL